VSHQSTTNALIPCFRSFNICRMGIAAGYDAGPHISKYSSSFYLYLRNKPLVRGIDIVARVNKAACWI